LKVEKDTDHIEFDPKNSSSWKTLAGASWNITYGDGTGASGLVGYDVLRLGNITIKDQAIEVNLICYIPSLF
jgi:hypothetical protein